MLKIISKFFNALFSGKTDAEVIVNSLSMELRSTWGVKRGAGGNAKADRAIDFIWINL
jgi:hypothetical protein